MAYHRFLRPIRRDQLSHYSSPAPAGAKFVTKFEFQPCVAHFFQKKYTKENMAEPERAIDILAICDEWKPSKGGLSAFNRELVINLAKVSGKNVNVHCFVSQSDDADREDAKKNAVNLVTAQKIAETDNPHEWLKFPPPELPKIDVVIGHGRKFGLAACFIKMIMTKCQLPCILWLQFLHVYCPDLGKYKMSKRSADCSAGDTIDDNERKHREEVELCEKADAVIAVGKELRQKYQRSLPDIEVHAFTPGIFDSFVLDQPPRQLPLTEEDKFVCLVCGRASEEDRFLKGYDIIADAIGNLGENYKLVFVGSPSGKQREIEEWFLKTKITREQLTICGYVDQKQLKKQIRTSDMLALPSRTEGFGLVALEAISADANVLVSKQAGISRVLQTIEGGSSVIVESGCEWVDRIRQLSYQTVQKRRENAVYLRKNYAKKYSWEEECQKLLFLIKKLMMRGM